MSGTSVLSRILLAATALASGLVAMPVLAQDAEAADEDAIVVTGEREVVLDGVSPTASRLGLSPRETPATIDILTQARLLERGLRTSNEALNSAPGIVAFNAGGTPGTISMRGFGGQAVSVAYDGVHLTNTTMTNRDYDGFAFERIEVLKGPSSVLFGEGALGGTVNYVTKKPMLGVREVQVLGSYGSLDSYRVAADLNVPLGSTAAVRAVVSRAATDGYIDRAGNRLTTANLGVLWQPSADLSSLFKVEYAKNNTPAPYWGTPLVTAGAARKPTDIVQAANGRVFDRAMDSVNYQYLDAEDTGESLWLRNRTEWTISDQWTLANDLSYNDGKRTWFDAWGFAYVPATDRVDRRADYIVNTFDFINERLTLSFDGLVAGLRNRVVVGAEVNQMDHFAVRRFGRAIGIDAWAPVDDPQSPVLGTFPEITPANFPGAGNYVDLGMKIAGAAVFAEHALNVTDKLLLVSGLRAERLELDQTLRDYNTNASSGFEKIYKPFSYRAGVVYSVVETAQLYAQYSRASAPVSSLTLLQASGSPYKLTQGESAEGGLKASFFGNKLETTAAVYWIRQSDIITRDPLNPTVSVQGGTQSSRGVEISASAALTSRLRLDANYAYVDAQFNELIEAGGADRTGNTPANVPAHIFNGFASYRFAQIPLTLTAGVRSVSHAFADNANTVRLSGYTVADASIGYAFGLGDLTLRARNIGNALYAVNGSTSAIYVGAPRTVDLTFRTRI